VVKRLPVGWYGPLTMVTACMVFRVFARCLNLAMALRTAHLPVGLACPRLQPARSRRLSPPPCVELCARAPHPAAPFAPWCGLARKGPMGMALAGAIL
jgi:hypothetical protein